MSDLLTKLDIKFHNRIRVMQDRFAQLKSATKSGALEVEDDFFDYVDDIEDVLESGRERIAAASDIVEDWVIESQENVEKWRARRETKKLMKEADKTQHYAEAAMDVALSALDEAEWALARAMMTRSYADTVTQQDAA